MNCSPAREREISRKICPTGVPGNSFSYPEDLFAGVAYEEGDNSSGSNGDIACRVYTQGDFQAAVTSAAVTDIGGVMSHAAIVCREYGMPAVVGTGRATSQIATGQRIRVDGSEGTVTILE